MMKIEIWFFSVNSFLLGISYYEGEDNNGSFRQLSIGALFVGIDFIMYGNSN